MYYNRHFSPYVLFSMLSTFCGYDGMYDICSLGYFSSFDIF